MTTANADIPLSGFLPAQESAPQENTSQPGHTPERIAEPAATPSAAATGTGPNEAPEETPEKTPEEVQGAQQEAALWAERLRRHEEGLRQNWQRQVEAWREEVARDAHLGGENLAASVARAQLALERFDTDRAIGRLLEQSGYGNHPAVMRFFNRLADALMEDSPVTGRTDDSLLPLEDRMYAGWRSEG